MRANGRDVERLSTVKALIQDIIGKRMNGLLLAAPDKCVQIKLIHISISKHFWFLFRIHTNERPFICRHEGCDAGYIDQYKRKVHENKCSLKKISENEAKI